MGNGQTNPSSQNILDDISNRTCTIPKKIKDFVTSTYIHATFIQKSSR